MHKFVPLNNFFLKFIFLSFLTVLLKTYQLYWLLCSGLCNNFLFGSPFFLKLLLTRQFYEFSFLHCSFPSWHAHFLGILLFFTYFFCMYKLYCAVRYTVLLYEDVIFTSLCRLLFYTIYRNKANNNHHKMAYNGLIWWHDKLLFHQNQGGWWDK